MDLAQLTARATEALSGGSDFKKKVKFDFGSVGKLLIDGANHNNSLRMAANSYRQALQTLGLELN
jgi:hypothetical protein